MLNCSSVLLCVVDAVLHKWKMRDRGDFKSDLLSLIDNIDDQMATAGFCFLFTSCYINTVCGTLSLTKHAFLFFSESFKKLFLGFNHYVSVNMSPNLV